MSITFAGQPVLLESRPLQDFLEDVLPLDFNCERSQPWSDAPFRINYSWPPISSLATNELWWPSGAQRWAICYLLATDEQETNIVESLDEQGFGDLVLTAKDSLGNDTTITANMLLLPPRQLTGAAGAKSLWLLPLVDARYLWQFYGMEQNVVDKTTAWSDAYAAIMAIVDDMNADWQIDAVPSQYLAPDPATIGDNSIPAAAMLDRIAFSVGQRVVMGLDGTVSISNAATSAGVDDANQGLSVQVEGGSEFDAEVPTLPANVAVFFRQVKQSSSKVLGWYEPTPTSAPGTVDSSSVNPALNRDIVSTAYADMTGIDDLTADPNNVSDLQSLATQIATDYYAWLARGGFDVKYDSLVAFEPSGFQDYIIWSLGALRRETIGIRERICNTRIKSLPDNFGMFQQCSQNFYPDDNDDVFRVALSSSTISARSGTTPGSGTAVCKTIQAGALATSVATPDEFTVYNPFATAVDSGVWIEAAKDATGSWFIVAADCTS